VALVEALLQNLFGVAGKAHAHFSADCLFLVEGLNSRFLDSCKPWYNLRGFFYRGDLKTKLCDMNHLLTSLWMEYRHHLYSPNITSELGTLSKYVWDSAGRCCNSVPRSGLKDTYIFFCAFVFTTTCQHAFTLCNEGVWHVSLSRRMERVWSGTGTETAWRFGLFDQIMILNTATMRDNLIICRFRATL